MGGINLLLYQHSIQFWLGKSTDFHDSSEDHWRGSRLLPFQWHRVSVVLKYLATAKPLSKEKTMNDSRPDAYIYFLLLRIITTYYYYCFCIYMITHI